ncbi:MAG: vanadium-dependent haloperoxidase [Lewinellaceae bacterium]|nr:vanadium-dependent haloperoxidase [Lewinellaceae bacterium]
MRKNLLILALLALATAGVAQQSNKSKSKDRYREKDTPAQADVQDAVDRLGTLRALAEQELPLVTLALTQVMQHDATIPAVTGRYYAYSLLAGYETTARYQSKVSSLRGLINGMPAVLSFTPADSVFHPFASLWAILETGKYLMPSGNMLIEKQMALEQAFRQNGLSDRLVVLSKTAAGDVSRAILEYARSDGFESLVDVSRARPAPNPGAAQDMGLNGSSLRPFFIESSKPFALPDPMPFDTSAGSAFLRMVRESQESGGSNQTSEQRAIAEYWDAPAVAGKVPLAGHWMRICSQICTQQKMAYNQALQIHTALALTLADAYLVCWDEHNRNRRMPPQAIINRLLDVSWRPQLPAGKSLEYVSDYSVVSAAAAEVLTRLVGEGVAFLDETGTPPRRYISFRHAAEEAALSRLHAGTHFRDAVDGGVQSGRRLGLAVLQQWPKAQ